MEICELCGGTLVPMGALGSLLHFKCQNCGIQVNLPALPSSDEDEEEDENEPG